jgi:GMP synthase-like glutamine amidotransferase
MRCLREIVQNWGVANQLDVVLKEFDVRLKNEVPSDEFDIYISSGGPGSPLDSIDSEWEKQYFNWLKEIEQWNAGDNYPKKHVFFICHSFQLICRHYKTGRLQRESQRHLAFFQYI